jgi:serine/threonine-protein kinase
VTARDAQTAQRRGDQDVRGGLVLVGCPPRLYPEQMMDAARAERLPEGGTVTDARSPEAAPLGALLEAGALLGGRYRIARFVAAGGMGEVYEARDELLRDTVAVKLLRAELLTKAGAQERFADEIRMARKVTHVNVCRVHEVGIDGARVFYTMELHAGETLAARIRTSGPMAMEAIRPIAAQVLAGIGAAHAAGVVHADLKPSNVLLAAKGRVVVTDFGLALPCCATLACRCEMPHLVGTPAYMAPEQVTGGMLLDGTDLFAFGVILFEMLTGALPWSGATAIELAEARLIGARPSARARRPDVDPTWDEVIRHCLACERTARPEDAATVARALGLG